jgi:hypothetical protein
VDVGGSYFRDSRHVSDNRLGSLKVKVARNQLFHVDWTVESQDFRANAAYRVSPFRFGQLFGK